MSKLNPPATHSRAKAAVSANGNIQDLKTDKHQLIEILTMCLYGKGDAFSSDAEQISRLRNLMTNLVRTGNEDFISNACVFARTHMNIRTFPIIACVEFIKILRDTNTKYPRARLLVSSVVHRADQITDLLAYSLQVFGKKGAIPKSIIRGLADAFNKFNAYQFAKYNRSGAVKFTDALRIVHPKPKDARQALIFDQLMNDVRPLATEAGKLQSADTWESRSSAAGTNGQSKGDVWDSVVQEDKLGYQAMLMNLRNMIENCSPHSLDLLAKRLRSPERVEKSRVLPHQMLQAMNYTESVPVLHRALNDALELSLANVGALADKIWIVVDSSGSMRGNKSSVNKNFSAAQIAAIFAAAIARSAGRDPELSSKFKMNVTLFDSKARTLNLDINSPLVNLIRQMDQNMTGGCTNLSAAIDHYPRIGFKPDVTLIISDMQVNDMGNASVSHIPGTKIALNVCATPSTPVSDIRGWKQVSGFSSSVMDIIKHQTAGNDYMKLFETPFTGKFTLSTNQMLELQSLADDSAE